MLRLFGRLKEIRKIIHAIGVSLIPVTNAFIIVLLIMCVYAILGVQLFQDLNRGAFGTFTKSLYTMFCATTMDGWQELVVIPMFTEDELEDSENVPSNVIVVIFFISYFLVVCWTMLPVVVAILLDKFTQASNELNDSEAQEKLKISGINKLQHSLDPLLEHISHYESEADLNQKLEALFQSLKGDDEVGISAQAFTVNLGRKKFRNDTNVYVSQEDFQSITQVLIKCLHIYCYICPEMCLVSD